MNNWYNILYVRILRISISHNCVTFVIYNPSYIYDLLLGSGKTIVAEIAILRLLQKSPGAKVVYVAPLKALARERLADWRRKLGI